MSINVDEIWRQVKANHQKLDSCNRHNFSIDTTSDKKLGKKYKCANCGGEVDSTTKHWYEKGLEHGSIYMNVSSDIDIRTVRPSNSPAPPAPPNQK